MDIFAALTAHETAALNDADRSCEEANRQLGYTTAVFDESLRLKNTLDELEAQATKQPSWETLSILVNCEYRLFVLNQTTPLRNNPFLSHWVEAIQRLEKGYATSGDSQLQHGEEGRAITSSEISMVRVELIKALLQSRNPSQFARVSPRQLHTDYVELRQMSPFNIRTYIRMLEEEGIYERTLEPETSSGHDNTGSSDGPKRSELQQWKLRMLTRLETEPEAAIPELTHLPIELSYLDYLTTLLQEKTLQSLSIDPAPVVADYLQHSLRLMEQMGQPPPPAAMSSVPALLLDGGDQESHPVAHGREAQTRAVRLLLLFMRNLIRKALLPLESIFFEIQEICVRYVWIKEVREFRAFVEEGVGGEEGVG